MLIAGRGNKLSFLLKNKFERNIKSIRLATGCFLYLSFYEISVNAFASCANCASVSASPLTLRESPHIPNACSICSLENGISCEFFRPFTSVFLLWLKDALIIRNISFSFFTSTGGFSYRSSLITALPTLGLGIKQLGGTFATIFGFA